MTKQKVLAIVVCICIVWSSLAFFKYKLELHRSVPYNPKKITRNGEYLPHYGYTIVAMIDTNLAKAAQHIEEFLRASKLSKSYSPLPASSYHMTIYSIYQCGNRMIPPVERWVEATGNTITNDFWLPDKVLLEPNNKAMCIIQKYFTEPLIIEYASINIGDRIIKLTLEAEENSLQRIRNAREEFKKIYEDPDLSMEPIDERLHISLAYVYASVDNPDVKEWNKLNELVRPFNGAKLMLPSVYLFDSMKRYIPYNGPWFTDALSLFNSIGTKLNDLAGDRCSKNYYMQRISIAIQSGNAYSGIL